MSLRGKGCASQLLAATSTEEPALSPRGRRGSVTNRRPPRAAEESLQVPASRLWRLDRRSRSPESRATAVRRTAAAGHTTCMEASAYARDGWAAAHQRWRSRSSSGAGRFCDEPQAAPGGRGVVTGSPAERLRDEASAGTAAVACWRLRSPREARENRCRSVEHFRRGGECIARRCTAPTSRGLRRAFCRPARVAVSTARRRRA